MASAGEEQDVTRTSGHNDSVTPAESVFNVDISAKPFVATEKSTSENYRRHEECEEPWIIIAREDISYDENKSRMVSSFVKPVDPAIVTSEDGNPNPHISVTELSESGYEEGGTPDLSERM